MQAVGRLSLDVCKYLRLSKEKFANQHTITSPAKLPETFQFARSWELTEEASACGKKNPNYKATKKTVERWQKSSWCDRSQSTNEQHVWRGLDRGLFGGNVRLAGRHKQRDSDESLRPNYNSYKSRREADTQTTSCYATSKAHPRHFVLNVWH